VVCVYLKFGESNELTFRVMGGSRSFVVSVESTSQFKRNAMK